MSSLYSLIKHLCSAILSEQHNTRKVYLNTKLRPVDTQTLCGVLCHACTEVVVSATVCVMNERAAVNDTGRRQLTVCEWHFVHHKSHNEWPEIES